ncbi:MAG: metal-sensing transcriptional repressor [Rudaea sp.]
MNHAHLHATHPAIVARLKRAAGHLRSAIAMIEVGRPCTELAQQLHAIEKAVATAKKQLIHDHIDHCLDYAGDERATHGHSLAEFKEISKYL